MPYRVYAMDTYFYNSIARYPFATRCEMLAELGYDATYLTAWSEQSWNDVAKLKTVKQEYGLDVAAVYAVLDVAKPDPRITELMNSMEGCRTIELAIKSASDDDAVVRFLDGALATCERRGISIYLYPHINFWLERIEDAGRICRRINHPHLGAVFCGFHWYAVDGKELAARLNDAEPFLRQVNLCGSRRDPNGVGEKATIEPLDAGEMDNFAVLAHLQRIHFGGLIGFQGYSIGGDPYPNLKRSLATFRDMERRLEAHSSWAPAS